MKNIILFCLIIIFIETKALADYEECFKLPDEEEKIMQELNTRYENRDRLTSNEFSTLIKYENIYNNNMSDFCYDSDLKKFFIDKNTGNEIAINKEDYELLINNIELYKDYNYLVDLNDINTKDVKPCILGSFDQNNIIGINIIWSDVSKNNLDKTIDLVSGYINYIDKKNNKDMKLDIADAEYYECKNIDIKNCNGMECLKQLPKDCYFLLKPKNNNSCFDLKTNKTELMWIICNNEECKRSESIVEFNIYGD